MSSDAGRNDDLSVWPWPQRNNHDPHWLLDQRPHVIQGPAHSDLLPDSARGGWQITIILAPPDQAALEAVQPSAYEWCAAAQHALGLAAIGSQIDRERGTVTLPAGGAPSLTFAGTPALWWVANVSSLVLHACVDALIARTGASAPSATRAGARANCGDG